MKKILYISRKVTRCGVHDYGERIVNILKKSSSFKFVFGYPNNRNDMLELIAKYNPQAIIYNYHNAPLYWLNQSFTASLEIIDVHIPKLGIINRKINRISNLLFNFKCNNTSLKAKNVIKL